MGDSLVVHWLRLSASPAGARIQSLVGELRSRKLCMARPKQKKKPGVVYAFLPKCSLMQESMMIPRNLVQGFYEM